MQDALSERHFDHAIGDAALDQIFREARTLRRWRDKAVPNALLMAIYDLMRWGPTESNITPARFHFVVSQEAKARLKPLLDEGNIAQTMAAPATVTVCRVVSSATPVIERAVASISVAAPARPVVNPETVCSKSRAMSSREACSSSRTASSSSRSRSRPSVMASV